MCVLLITTFVFQQLSYISNFHYNQGYLYNHHNEQNEHNQWSNLTTSWDAVCPFACFSRLTNESFFFKLLHIIYEGNSIYSQILVPLRHLHTNAKPKFITAMDRCFNARHCSSNPVSARKTLTTAPLTFVQRLITAGAKLAKQR